MSKFLERHKRKSLLAALLLFLRSRRGFGALLLLVLLLMLLFVVPPGKVGELLARVPGGGWIAHQLDHRGPRSFQDLIAAFNEAKRRGGSNAWNLFFHDGSGSRGAGTSSVDMVRGSKSELDGSGDGSLADKIKNGGGNTINGVLTEEDAGKRADGVDLSDQGNGGLEGQAYAGGFGGPGRNGLGSGWGGKAGLVSAGLFGAGLSGGAGQGFGSGGPGSGGGFGGAFVSQNFFSGHVGPYAGDPLRAALGSTSVPKLGKGQSFGAVRYKGQKGTITGDGARAANSKYSAHNTIGGTCLSGTQCAFHQLAATRAHVMSSRDPACTADNGCPPEYASTNSGASYDGNHVGDQAPNVVTTNGAAPQIDGITTPTINPPNQADVNQYQQEAQDLEQDANACKSDEQSALQQQDRDLMTKLSDLSKQASDACGGGGCGPSDVCQSIMNQEKQTCTQLNDVQYKRCNACPLTKRQGCGSGPNDTTKYTNCS